MRRPWAKHLKGTHMRTTIVRSAAGVILGLLVLALVVRAGQDRAPAAPQGKDKDGLAKDLEGWTHEFGEDKADLTHTGRNRYFILEPGWYLVLEKGDTRIVI